MGDVLASIGHCYGVAETPVIAILRHTGFTLVCLLLSEKSHNFFFYGLCLDLL